MDPTNYASVVAVHVSPAARIGKQPNLFIAVTMKAVGILTHISSKLEHLSKVFIPTNQLENERCARRQFPSILSQTPPRLLGIAKHLSLWTWGLPRPVTINRRNFQTEIETEANKWSEFDGPVPSFRSGTVYGE